MSLLAVSRMAASRTRVAAPQQRRGFIDWMVKYPDTVMAKKKIQMAGGVKQGEANPTWLKQSGDVQVLAFGGALVGFGLIQLVMGIYKLAYNKGRKE